jgi:hypothetical protein
VESASRTILPVSDQRKQRLKALRAELLVEFDAVDSAGALFEFQERLAREIIAAEPAAFRDKASPERGHIRLMRLIGDGLAWRYLHSYTIRQLGKLETAPPALSHQGGGFASTVEIAHEYAAAGVPALIADLTNCICVSDVVVCTDPERPLLVESGGNPRALGKGRKGRQLQRGLAVTELLSQGHGKLPEDEHTTLTVPIDVEAEYTWQQVAAASEEALENGTGVAIASPDDVIWAVVETHEDPMPDAALDAGESFKRSAAIGVHLRLLEKPNARHQPPVLWPIPFESRLALLEREIYLGHAINTNAFLDDPGTPEPRIVDHRLRRDEITGFVVHGREGQFELSPIFLNDVLYGYQTIESTRKTMLAGVRKAEIAEMPSEREERPAGGVFVESLAELRALAADPERREQAGTVSMPKEVFTELQDVAREHGLPGLPGAVMGVAPSQRSN